MMLHRYIESQSHHRVMIQSDSDYYIHTGGSLETPFKCDSTVRINIESQIVKYTQLMFYAAKRTPPSH